MPKKFEVGDRVVTPWSKAFGLGVGTIVRVGNDFWDYLVQWDRFSGMGLAAAGYNECQLRYADEFTQWVSEVRDGKV